MTGCHGPSSEALCIPRAATASGPEKARWGNDRLDELEAVRDPVLTAERSALGHTQLRRDPRLLSVVTPSP